MLRFAVIGHPVSHSLSPAMHNAAFAAAGIDAVYSALDVPPDRLQETVERLVADGFAGFNVTLPHKETVLPLLSGVDRAAELAGAVNTVRIERIGDGTRLIGFNTDGPGFLNSLREDAGFVPAGKRVVVVGAGGNGRTLAAFLADGGASRVTLVNRTPARAEAVAAALAARLAARFEAIPLAETPRIELALRDADLVVNASSAGLGEPGGRPVIDLTPAKPGCLVVDTVYRPRQTPLLSVAQKRGLRAVSGVGMFVWQGALAWRHWGIGRPAPIGLMRSVAEEGLAEDSRREL